MIQKVVQSIENRGVRAREARDEVVGLAEPDERIRGQRHIQRFNLHRYMGYRAGCGR